MVDKTLTSLTALARYHSDIAALWLYGSRSNGTFNENSDYDLAVLFYSRLNDALERRLRPELLALDWTKSLELKDRALSVIDIQTVPIPLAMNAIAGQLLYCGDYSARLIAEGIIMSKAELDYHYHSKHF